ncbi:hypothetical protein [Acidobacterium sp. S8]|uniref:hypothetical protein n=1 Tax=Acidobacterium sp. S8 TaxID=1641854 RepID=UPI0020B114AB|nr:hypothetical protein [Acidobacterium sp. S8]
MLLSLLLLPAFSNSFAASSSCDNIPHADHPKASLTNGDINAVVFLPDPAKGYYRSTRFDWAGVIPCLSYKGHTYWGEWFHTFDPLVNDSITGPVEEFRSEDGALGYAAAKPGELFVKVGVGTLRKLEDKPYKFGTAYPLVDTGKWTVKTSKRSVRFQQTLQSPIGFAYVYTKTVQLDKHGAVLSLEHELKNTGSKAIVTDVYDHDFFMLDGQPTGPGMTVRFRFNPASKPSPDNSFDPSMAKMEGNEIGYLKELQTGQTVSTYITGYSDKASDYDITVENANTGAGVEQTSDSPIAKFYLWSIRSTISPEAYIHLDVPPGKTQSWQIHYRFFTR